MGESPKNQETKYSHDPPNLLYTLFIETNSTLPAALTIFDFDVKTPTTHSSLDLIRERERGQGNVICEPRSEAHRDMGCNELDDFGAVVVNHWMGLHLALACLS